MMTLSVHSFIPHIKEILLSIVRSFTASGQKLQIHIICYVSSIKKYLFLIPDLEYQSAHQMSMRFIESVRCYGTIRANCI